MNKLFCFLTAFTLCAATSLFAEISETLPSSDDSAGFVSIFNGKDLTGWEGLSEFWSVKDGAITGQTTEGHIPKENTFLVWKDGQPGDFELHCQFKLVANNSVGFANSGIQYRSKVLKPEYWVVGGYQADMENGPTYSGILYEEKGRGILAKRGERVVINPDGKKEIVGSTGKSEEIEAQIKKGDWNDYVVIAKGNHLMHFINGQQTVDVIDQQADKAAKSGVIALQIHRGQPMLVQFKNFKIKQFDTPAQNQSGTKKIVFIAGKPSHGPGDHEYRAGFLLLQKCLANVPGITSVVYSNDWPTESHALDGAAAIVMFSDGTARHPALQDDRLQQLGELMKKGVGFGCIHYAVEPVREKGEKEFIDWMGGAFEVYWSVNPFWTADFKQFPQHPVTRGVQPFSINDEWYFNMRFRPNMEGVTPILTAVPPPETMSRPDGDHSGNPAVRKMVEEKLPQHVMWVAERPDGGRGFGFTGGHRHTNWGDDNFRKVVLNAIVWIAKADVPENGVASTVTPEDLKQNLDRKGGKKKVKKQPANNASQSTKPAASNRRAELIPQVAVREPAKAAKPIFRSGVTRSGRTTIDVDISNAGELWLAATDGGEKRPKNVLVWGDPKLIRADGSEISLSELTPKVVAGDVHRNNSVGGKTLKILQKSYRSGFGTTAPCLMGFELPAGFKRLYIKAGIDLAVDPHTTTKPDTEVPADAPKVEFVVFTDQPSASFLKQPFDTTQRYGPAAAQASLKDFKVAGGLEVSLFASEPMLRNPTDMDMDAQGRAWVCEGVNYRSTFQPWGIIRPAGDRVVILEDTDGDGLADKETTFYQGPEINSALGICVLGNKAIVSCSPNVFVFTDTDGDGRADQKEILFSGIGGVDHDHGVHAFTFGPDGKLYFNFGNESKHLKRPDGSPVLDIEGREVSAIGKPFRNGMVLRCNLDGSEVEVLGYNFRNPYEAAVDSFGTVWQSDNDDDGSRAVRINYIMEHGNFGFYDELTGANWSQKRSNMEEETALRHWHQNDPGVVPNLTITGAGAPTGIAIYEGKLLPKTFQNQMILCDAGTRLVRSYPVHPDGAGYKTDAIDILTSSDAWFRPSDVCVAPDGSLYIADWNDAGVGGHNMADRDFSTMTGRIYRVAPKGNKSTTIKFQFDAAAHCMEALRSPNNAARYLAWTKLHEMGAKSETALLKDWRGKDERLRARSLQLLARIPGREQKYLKQAIHDSNPDIRIASLRIARAIKVDVIPYVEKLADDPNAQVRRECAIALRHNTSQRAAELWAALALKHDGKDRMYLEALGIGADGNQEKFFTAWLKKVGDNWNIPGGRDIIWRSRAPGSADYLAKIIAAPTTPDADRARYFRAFDFIPACSQKQQALVKLLAVATN